MYDEEVSCYEQEIKFITGFAGSGKSTKISKTASDQTLIMVPTHKAADVLKGKGLKNVYTIYSVLKLVPTIDENFRPGDKIQKLVKIGDSDLKTISTVIIDEFSMIPTHILDMLLFTLPSHCKVLVVGDPYQLPPVSGQLPNPWDYTSDIEELTTQHRADAPEVVETFMRFMEYIKTGDNRISLKVNPAITRSKDLSEFNPRTDRALAFTNDKVLEINSKIEDMLGGDDTSNDYIINDIDVELLDTEPGNMFIFPKCIVKGKLLTGEDLELASSVCEADIDKWNTDLTPYNVNTISYDGTSYNIYVDSDYHNTSKRLKRKVEDVQAKVYQSNDIPSDVKLAKWCRDNPHAPYVKERGRAWSEFLAHSTYVFSLRRPYATTVHKAQGQEFDKVFIAMKDMQKSIKDNYYGMYARLMYVALSRAIKKVYIID